MYKTNFVLLNSIITIMCCSIILFNGCTTTTAFKQPGIEQNKLLEVQNETKKYIPPSKNSKPAIEENKTIITPPSKEHGSGYLSEGSALSVGVMDGDEELKVLHKVRRLETRLETERNKTETLSTELSKLQTAKEGVEKNFADTKKKLEGENAELLDVIKSLESKLKESEARSTTTEQELASVKKELLKTRIVETKAQQELYKLKIENLKQNKE